MATLVTHMDHRGSKAFWEEKGCNHPTCWNKKLLGAPGIATTSKDATGLLALLLGTRTLPATRWFL